MVEEETQGSDEDELLDFGQVSVPSFYVDVAGFGMTSYTVTLNLGLRRGPKAIQPQAQILMSPQHAKMFVILLTRAIKALEERTGGPIQVPDALLEAKEISLDTDW